LKYHQSEREKYIDYANFIISKRKKFYEKLEILDKKENCILQKDYDYLYYLKNDYLYYNFVSKALNEMYSSKKDYVAIFLTLTLDTMCHKYKLNKKSKFILNQKYDEKVTINRGYKILQNFYRTLYKNFRVNHKYIHFDFVRVIEPHGDFTPHLHSIIYIKKEYLSHFYTFLDAQIAKNNYMGKYELEVLQNISRANAYIMKYMQKSFVNTQNEDDLKMFMGWKLKNKIRAFTSSQILLHRNVFNKIGFAKIGRKFLHNEGAKDYLETSNLYRYYSYVTWGQTIIRDPDGENEKIRTYNDTTFEEIGKRVIYKIVKYRRKKKNIFIEQCIQEILRYDDLYIKMEILEEDEKIKKMFDDFLFFNYNLSWLEFYDDPKYEIIDNFIIDLKRKLYSYRYRIDEYRVSKRVSLENYEVVFNKKDYKLLNKAI